MDLVAACIASFGIGLLAAVMSIPDSVFLIRHGDRMGWITPVALVFAVVLIVLGVHLHA